MYKQICTTTFTATILNSDGVPDRFEEPFRIMNIGPRREYSEGTPPETFSWSVSYPDPREE